jgi:hypothetical protein
MEQLKLDLNNLPYDMNAERIVLGSIIHDL